MYSFEDYRSGKKPPKGWDCADAIDDGWTEAQVTAWLKASLTPFTPPDPTPKPQPEQKPKPAPQPARRKPVSRGGGGWVSMLMQSAKGGVEKDKSSNIALVVENHDDTVGVFRFDEFRQRIMVMRAPPWDYADGFKERSLCDADYVELHHHLERPPHEFKVKPGEIPGMINMVAQRHAFDPLREYLEGLEWDGTPRIERLFVDYMGAEDTPYNRTIGVRFCISAAARGLSPGIKVDTMPILEGPQGLKKSTAVKALFAPRFVTEHLSSIGSKDAMMELGGVWAVEVAEMHKMTQAETAEVKKFLSQQVDRFRPPYGKNIVEAPRRCVLVGTINPEGNPYLTDATGARRFWPVECGRVDIASIERDRDQFWAEAVARFKAGEPHWIQESEMRDVERQQELRTDVDPWTDAIVQKLRGVTEIFQIDLIKAVEVPLKDVQKRHTDRIGRIMMRLGWRSIRERTPGGERIRYVKQQDRSW